MQWRFGLPFGSLCCQDVLVEALRNEPLQVAHQTKRKIRESHLSSIIMVDLRLEELLAAFVILA